jgi:hypothetical protein
VQEEKLYIHAFLIHVPQNQRKSIHCLLLCFTAHDDGPQEQYDPNHFLEVCCWFHTPFLTFVSSVVENPVIVCCAAGILDSIRPAMVPSRPSAVDGRQVVCLFGEMWWCHRSLLGSSHDRDYSRQVHNELMLERFKKCLGLV